jgi:hypothetical protein
MITADLLVSTYGTCMITGKWGPAANPAVIMHFL